MDRKLMELLGELRVALPGVQVLFAFLLVVPFNQGFRQVTDFQKNVYFVTLLCTATASVFLIAPSVHHRMTKKEQIMGFADNLTLVGLTFLALAMIGVMLLVTDYLFSTLTAVVATASVAVLFGVVWYALPLLRRPE
jgi:drug/metabolite transporter (DMT)-like permease